MTEFFNLIERRLDNGLWLTLRKLHAGQYYLTIGTEWDYLENWCYHHLDRAQGAWLSWDGTGDPEEGWYRHVESGRRRDDYTKASERIQP